MRDGDLEIAKRSLPGSDSLFLLIRTTRAPPLAGRALCVGRQGRPQAPGEPALEFPFDEYLLRNGYLTALVEASEPADVPEQLEAGTTEQDPLDHRGRALRDSAGRIRGGYKSSGIARRTRLKWPDGTCRVRGR